MRSLSMVGCGIVSGVGVTAPATCAAVRCGIDNIQETRFMDAGGEWFRGSEVRLEAAWEGEDQLDLMLARALAECLSCDPGARFEETPVIVCVAEPGRPGRRLDLNDYVFVQTQQRLGVRFHEASTVIDRGRTGIATALRAAREMIQEEKFGRVIIAGVDSLISAPALSSFEEQSRLLTSRNSNGFIPGEAAGAVLLTAPSTKSKPELLMRGVGVGTENATIESDLPCRADGLVQAFKEALADARCTMDDLDFRIADVSGEQYYFREAGLAVLRTLRGHKSEFDLWHPADCLGEVGAAVGAVILSVAMCATKKAYAPGNDILCHFGSDDGERAAVIVSYRSGWSH